MFDNALNVMVSEEIYTILYNPLWISETNIILDKPAAALIAQSRTFASDGHYLYADDTSVADFSGSRYWSMPKIPKTIDDSICRMIAEKIDAIHVSDTISYISKRFTEEAASFIRKQKVTFENIIGAGPGLTPSGDDILTGFALALLSAAPERLAELEALCTPLLHTTTDISRQLLKNAFKGRFTAPLVNVLLSTTNNLEKNLEIALNVGASSGRDGIFGLYTGLALFN